MECEIAIFSDFNTLKLFFDDMGFSVCHGRIDKQHPIYVYYGTSRNTNFNSHFRLDSCAEKELQDLADQIMDGILSAVGSDNKVFYLDVRGS